MEEMGMLETPKLDAAPPSFLHAATSKTSAAWVGQHHDRPSSFHALVEKFVAELQEKHESELEALRSELKRLQDAVDKSQGPVYSSTATPLARPPRALADLELDLPLSPDGQPSRTSTVAGMPSKEETEAVTVLEMKTEGKGDTGPGSPEDQAHAPSRPRRHSSSGLPAVFQRLAKEEEEVTKSFRQKGREFMQGGTFEAVIAAFIILNVIAIYLQLEFVGYSAGVSLGVQAARSQSWVDMLVLVLSHFFTIVFALELLLKMFFLGLKLFYSHGALQRFNIFDAIVVLLTVVDMWILSPMQAGFNVSVLRLMRFVRVFRALRIVRAFEVFSKLRVLVATVSASFFALFWSMVLLTVVMLLAALVMCRAVNTSLSDPDLDMETKLWSYRYYGTPSRSMWTVFELTFSGGWPNYARVLVEKVSPLYAAPFVVYIAGVIFAMFRIITALFLRDTLIITALFLKEKHAYAQKLRCFFEAADASGDGYLTFEEFESVLEDERIMSYLASMELDVTQTRLLFGMLDDGDQKVSVDEFVRGAIRLKGQARSQDVVAIMHDCNKMIKKLQGLEDNLDALSARLHSVAPASPASRTPQPKPPTMPKWVPSPNRLATTQVVPNACVDL